MTKLLCKKFTEKKKSVMRYGSTEERDVVILNELKLLGVRLPKCKKWKSTHLEQEVRYNLEVGKPRLFGVNLSDQDWIFMKDKYVPRFLALCSEYLLQHLHSEGLFRKTGSVARQKKLRIHMENGGMLEGTQPDDVASLLKQWLRELPEPVIPFYLQEVFIRCHQVESASTCATALLLSCLLLPPEHLHTLCHLVLFLKAITDESSANKMDAYNLAVIIAPSLLPCSFGEKRDKARLCVLHQRRVTSVLQGCEPSNNIICHQTGVVQTLIENANLVGEVPVEIAERLHIQDLAVEFMDDLEKNDVDIMDAGHVKSRKKRRSGTVHELMNGIKKFVGRTNPPASKECCSLYNKENEELNIIVTRSSCKRKADMPILCVPKKRLLEGRQEVPNSHLQADENPLQALHTHNLNICTSPGEQTSAKPQRKSLGTIRKQKGSQTPLKPVSLSEKKIKQKCKNTLKTNNSHNSQCVEVQIKKTQDSWNKEIIQKVNSLAISSPEEITKNNLSKYNISKQSSVPASKNMPRRDSSKCITDHVLCSKTDSNKSLLKEDSQESISLHNSWPYFSSQQHLIKTAAQKTGGAQRNSSNLNRCVSRVKSDDRLLTSSSDNSLNQPQIKRNSASMTTRSSSKTSVTANMKSFQQNSQLKSPQSKKENQLNFAQNKLSHSQMLSTSKISLRSHTDKDTGDNEIFSSNLPKTSELKKSHKSESCNSLRCKRTPISEINQEVSNKEYSRKFTLKSSSEKKFLSQQESLLSDFTPDKLLKRNSSYKSSLRRGRPNTVLTGLPSNFRSKHGSDTMSASALEINSDSLKRTSFVKGIKSDSSLILNTSEEDCVVKTLNFSDVFHPETLLNENSSPLQESSIECVDESVTDEINSNTKQSFGAEERISGKFNDSGLGKSTDEILNSSLVARKCISLQDIKQRNNSSTICSKSSSCFELSKLTLLDAKNVDDKSCEKGNEKQKEFSSHVLQEITCIKHSEQKHKNLPNQDNVNKTSSIPCQQEYAENLNEPKEDSQTSESIDISTSKSSDLNKHEPKTPILQETNEYSGERENWVSAEIFLSNLEPPSLRDEQLCQRESVIRLRHQNAGLVQASVQRYNSIICSPSQLPKRGTKNNHIPLRVPSIFNRNESGSLKERRCTTSGRKNVHRRSSSFEGRDTSLSKSQMLSLQKRLPKKENKKVIPLKTVVEASSPLSNSASPELTRLRSPQHIINSCHGLLESLPATCDQHSNKTDSEHLSSSDNRPSTLVLQEFQTNDSLFSHLPKLTNSDNPENISDCLDNTSEYTLQSTHSHSSEQCISPKPKLSSSEYVQRDHLLHEWEVHM